MRGKRSEERGGEMAYHVSTDSFAGAERSLQQSVYY